MGTKWYQTGVITNDLPSRLAVDPARWILFANDEFTVNGISGKHSPMNEGDCPTLVLPATVSDGVVVFGKGASKVPDGNYICGARIGTFATGKVTVAVAGRGLRMSIDEGMNKSVRIFSADPPAAPSVPSTVDLSFLGAPTGSTVRERLANDLAGRTFVATKITGRTVAKPGITMTFGVDQIGLYAGCNHGAAGYSIDGSTVIFNGMRSTGILCEDPGGDQERWLYDFVKVSAQFELSGSTLRLEAHGQTMVLDEKPADATPQQPDLAPSAAQTEPAGAPPALLASTIDEIVTPRGVQPLPEFEQGSYWNQPPQLLIQPDAIVFDVGCGQQWSDTTGASPTVTAGAYTGDWLLQCPPKRSALAAALSYILSGPLTIERDGGFFTITGRDGLAVTSHSGS